MCVQEVTDGEAAPEGHTKEVMAWVLRRDGVDEGLLLGAAHTLSRRALLEEIQNHRPLSTLTQNTRVRQGSQVMCLQLKSLQPWGGMAFCGKNNFVPGAALSWPDRWQERE